jgi:hypothetical protein
MATIIASARLKDVEPLAYLADFRERIVSSQTKPTEIVRVAI